MSPEANEVPELKTLEKMVLDLKPLGTATIRRILTYLADLCLGAGVWTRHPLMIRRLSPKEIETEIEKLQKILEEAKDA